MYAAPCTVKTDPQGRELAAHGTTLFPAACYQDMLAQAAIAWHWHEEWEVILVAHGTAVVSGNDRPYTLAAGDGFFLNSGTLHSICDAGQTDCRLRSLVFHPRLLGGSADSIFWQRYLQPLLSDRALPGIALRNDTPWGAAALCCISDAWSAYTEAAFGYEFAVRDSLSRLLVLLAAHQPAAQQPLSEKALRSYDRIKQMLQYLQIHYAEELTTADIAHSAAISTSECLRCFRSVLGTTPIAYLKQLRLQKAAELLLHTDEKIAEIGVQCGFQEMSYFAKAFRLQKGCTPSEYRRRNTGRADGITVPPVATAP